MIGLQILLWSVGGQAGGPAKAAVVASALEGTVSGLLLLTLLGPVP